MDDSAERHATRRWISDFRAIPLDECESYLYSEPNCVKEWLGRKDLFILAAGKGMGKTLLLQVKHQKLYEQYKDTGGQAAEAAGFSPPSERVYFIPNNAVDQLTSLSNQKWAGSWAGRFLEDSVQATHIWTVSLCVSLIAQVCGPATKEYLLDAFKLHAGQALHEYFENYFKAGDINLRTPTNVLTHLLSDAASESIVKDICRNANLFIEQVKNQVRFTVYMFVDATDEIDCASQEKSIWVNIQTGLAEAAWSISQANKNIRIYTAIRLEAWSSYDHANKQNIEMAVCQINYNDYMNPMMEYLFQKYENNSLNQIVGFNSLRSPLTYIRETPAEFILRHTLLKQREIVKICGVISDWFDPRLTREMSIEERENRFKHAVHEYSGRRMIEELFKELSLFLTSLAPERDQDQLCKLDKLLKAVKCNILTPQEVNRAAENFGYLAQLKSENHPFRDLYRLGLMGIIETRELKGLQRFHNNFDQGVSSWRNIHVLPEAEFYVLHPCLTHRIMELYGRPYKLVFGIKTGEGIEIDELGMNLIRLQKGLSELIESGSANKSTALELMTILEDLFIIYADQKQPLGESEIISKCDRILSLWKSFLESNDEKDENQSKNSAYVNELYFNVADILLSAGANDHLRIFT